MVKVNHSGLRTWLEIDTKALKSNYLLFKKIIGPKTKLMAVVKSNAYGHGLVETSQYFAKFGADFLGVDSIVEARSLRQNGVQAPILVFGFTLPEMIDYAVKNDVSLTVSSLDFLKILAAKKLTKKLKIHLKIETGLNRQGLNKNQIKKVISLLPKNPKIIVEGAYTHFADAKNPQKSTRTNKQIEIFRKLTSDLRSNGLEFITHASASSSSFIYGDNEFDMVRVGISMYGLWPSELIKREYANKHRLTPSLSWKTVIGEINQVSKGERIGYGKSQVLKKACKIAVCPVGYFHGYPRNLSNKGFFLVNGKKAKILGAISMDMTMIDITKINDAKFNQEVTIVGKNKNGEITVDELSKIAKTTNYEFISRINPRIKRFYI